MEAIANAVGLGPNVIHCVFFKFAAGAEQHLVEKTCNDFIALAQDCKNRKGKKYIKSIEGGIDVSIEARAKGFTHGFIATFSSLEDRDYYIREDPIHLGFAGAASASKIEDTMVFDFVVGKFKPANK